MRQSKPGEGAGSTAVRGSGYAAAPRLVVPSRRHGARFVKSPFPLRRLVKLGIVLVLLLGAAGHVLYWYWPRERAAAPEAGSYASRLLASGAYGVCLWVPYPHQNLGALSASVGDG